MADCVQVEAKLREEWIDGVKAEADRFGRQSHDEGPSDLFAWLGLVWRVFFAALLVIRWALLARLG